MNRRVVFVAPFGLGQKTTVWARTLPLARQLAQHGWEPTLLIPPWDTPQDAGRRWQEAGVSVVQVETKLGAVQIFYQLLHEIFSLNPAIVQTVKPRAYAGLVHWTLWYTLRRSPQRPLLLLDTDDWEQAWSAINCYPWPLTRFLEWQEDWGIRHADAVTAARRWLAAEVTRSSPKTPVLYLPNGVLAPAQDAPRWEAGGRDVLFFSRFVEVSPDWLTKFAVILHEKIPAARLLVAGTPVQPGLEKPFHSALQQAAAQQRAVSVAWLGYVDQKQLAALYRQIGCAIFPAQPTALQQAKCSVRLATTLLAGVPVVASAVGEQTTYGADGAAHLVAADGSPEEFADAVCQLLADPARQAALSSLGNQHLLAQYSWPILGNRLHSFYCQLLAARQGITHQGVTHQSGNGSCG